MIHYYCEHCMRVSNAVIELMDYSNEMQKNGGLSLYDYFNPEIMEKPGELDFSITLLEEAARLVKCELENLQQIKAEIEEQRTGQK